MTKQKAAVPATVTSTEVASMELKPNQLRVIGPTPTALAQAAVHIREGMIFCPRTPIDVFGPAGTIGFTLVLGNPDQSAIDAAAASKEHAVQLQQTEYRKEVEAEAKRIVEAAARAEKQAEIAAEIADKQKALRTLQAALEAV